MFVFKVLEDMMSRGMYGLAEDVVSYVGVGKKDPEAEVVQVAKKQRLK